ncbi:MAG TPA: hypothetical protein VFN90_05895 [Gemmatimonadales bacterium]|nr:hypothetical protein [Gemmatimonadales bacterium]
MMRLALLAILLLVSGCSWSNSMHLARRFARTAERADREGRGGDAENAWAQSAVKADSVIARAPTGKPNPEALYLAGRARAELNDCTRATPLLEQAYILAPEAGWATQLRLALGSCRALADDPRALELLTPLTEAADPAVRGRAREVAGRLYVRLGRWQEAVTLLAADTAADARFERAFALAGLDRTDDALAELAPVIAQGDTTVGWARFLDLIAAQDAEDARTLATRLAAMPSVSPALRGSWALAAARGALRGATPGAGEAWLTQLATDSVSRTAAQARLALAEHRLARVPDVAALRPVAATLTGWLSTTLGSDALFLRRVERIAGRLVGDHDSLPPGAPLGDLAAFHGAEVARDSLANPTLAAALLAHLERGWPDSPYVVKALLARVILVPDSADALRARIATFPGSPYLAYLQGRDDGTFARLEDSLATFVRTRAIRAEVRRADPTEVFE